MARSASSPPRRCCSAASSGSPRTAASTTRPSAEAAGAAPRPVVCVAFSGGLDSTALLHATAKASQTLGLFVVALHVHHGLSDRADRWLEHTRALCRRWSRRGWAIGHDHRRLDGRPGAGDSVEAWAREGRYAALADMARAAGSDLVLLAQHRRDQAETFVLQALRGAGVAGLAAMPRSALQGGITWARPWLDTPREAIEAYARRHRLRFVDDPSNGDARYARSRLRQDVWPALRRAFPQAEASFADAARLIADARAVVEERTGADLEDLRTSPTPLAGEAALDVARWRGLPAARGRFVLVAWLRERLGGAPPRSLVERLSGELHRAGALRWPAPGGELRRVGGRLVYRPS